MLDISYNEKLIWFKCLSTKIIKRLPWVCPGEPHKVLNNATESKTKNVDVGTKIFVIQIQLGICIAF